MLLRNKRGLRSRAIAARQLNGNRPLSPHSRTIAAHHNQRTVVAEEVSSTLGVEESRAAAETPAVGTVATPVIGVAEEAGAANEGAKKYFLNLATRVA
jgi:hypothetical protein